MHSDSLSLDIDRLRNDTFVARVEYHPVLTSTNDRARQCAAEGPGPLPLLVVADRQSAGRGRGGNRWWTAPGSLAFSLLLEAGAADRSRSPLMGLTAALAVVQAIAPLVTEERVGLHWPNDVMAGPRKLAGVLVEVLPDGRPIVGIGLNVNNSRRDAPPELQDRVATLLDLTGRQYDPTAVLVDLLRRFQKLLGELAIGPERVAAQAGVHCLQRGAMLTLRLGDRSFSGRCAGIAADGALLLDTPEGRQAFCSGVLDRKSG